MNKLEVQLEPEEQKHNLKNLPWGITSVLTSRKEIALMAWPEVPVLIHGCSTEFLKSCPNKNNQTKSDQNIVTGQIRRAVNSPRDQSVSANASWENYITP